MKHYVLGLIFGESLDSILLINKKEPDWMKGFWNGVGGKIKDNETPIEAMYRETSEEIKCGFSFEHVITFVCPGGTVFVYKAVSNNITPFGRVLERSGGKNDVGEIISTYLVNKLPKKLMADLKWMIPMSLSTIRFPILVHQKELGTVVYKTERN